MKRTYNDIMNTCAKIVNQCANIHFCNNDLTATEIVFEAIHLTFYTHSREIVPYKILEYLNSHLNDGQYVCDIRKIRIEEIGNYQSDNVCKFTIKYGVGKID